jgi:quinol monooxygenase YgiN
MSKVIVRYRVKPECAEENERLVRAVYEELQQRGVEGLSYATFRLEDGLSFVHIASVTDAAANPLVEVEAFREFQKDIAERCSERPVVSELQEVGSFRFWP